MPSNPRDRNVFPFAVPIAILAVVIALVWVFSRILLNVPKEVAVAVAFMTALNILITCGVISVRRLTGFAAVFLVIVISVPVVLGGAAAAKAIKVKIPAKVVVVPPVLVSAANTAFDTKTIQLPAKDAKIKFENKDSTTHNIHIYQGADATGQSVFSGDAVSAGASATYDIGSLPAGSYFFRCDFHPTAMTGTVVVGGSGGGGSGSSNALTISAANTAFNTAALTAKAGSDVTVAFDNKDTTFHNFDVYSGPAGYTPKAGEATIAAPGKTVTYDLGSLAAGTYKYKCDLHPTIMTGTLTVQ